MTTSSRRTAQQIARDTLDAATARVDRCRVRVERLERQAHQAHHALRDAEQARAYAAAHPLLQADSEPVEIVEAEVTVSGRRSTPAVLAVTPELIATSELSEAEA